MRCSSRNRHGPWLLPQVLGEPAKPHTNGSPRFPLAGLIIWSVGQVPFGCLSPFEHALDRIGVVFVACLAEQASLS